MLTTIIGLVLAGAIIVLVLGGAVSRNEELQNNSLILAALLAVALVLLHYIDWMR